MTRRYLPGEVSGVKYIIPEEYRQFETRAGVKGNRFWTWHVQNGGYTRRFEASAEPPPTSLQTARAEGYTEELNRTGRIA
jgi:hypothetical protein